MTKSMISPCAMLFNNHRLLIQNLILSNWMFVRTYAHKYHFFLPFAAVIILHTYTRYEFLRYIRNENFDETFVRACFTFSKYA